MREAFSINGEGALTTVGVQSLDVDFVIFSGHNVFCPAGIGVVYYGKRAVLEDMLPWQGGGNVIADVTFERTVYRGPPPALRPAPAHGRCGRAGRGAGDEGTKFAFRLCPKCGATVYYTLEGYAEMVANLWVCLQI